MTTTLLDDVRRMIPVSAPSSQGAALRTLAGLLDGAAHADAPRCTVSTGADGAAELPASVFFVLERAVEVLARGDSVTVVPVGQMLTTQQAADLLNVPRRRLVKLLEDGSVPFIKTGKHRRVKIEDVLVAKKKRDRERRADLRDLTRLTEEVFGYGGGS